MEFIINEEECIGLIHIDEDGRDEWIEDTGVSAEMMNSSEMHISWVLSNVRAIRLFTFAFRIFTLCVIYSILDTAVLQKVTNMLGNMSRAVRQNSNSTLCFAPLQRVLTHICLTDICIIWKNVVFSN